MAEFCTKCFTALNDDGQCPMCGHRNTPAVVAAPVPTPVAPATATIPVTPVIPVVPVAPVIPEVPDVPEVAAAPALRFCTMCGGNLNENGLCPVCHAPAPIPAPIPVAVPDFCTQCGSRLNDEGLCPACDVPADIPAPTPITGFCVQCGGPLSINGSCPVCDAIAPTTGFCVQCGGQLDENGLCPVCDAIAPTAGFCVQCGGQLDENGLCPICTAAPAPIAEKKQPQKTSPLSVIASVLLSICLFVTMLLSVSVLTVRNTISEGGVSNLITELDVSELMKSSGVVSDNNSNEFLRRLERDYGVKIDEDDLGEMIEDSTVPEFVAEKVGDFSGDFFSGNAELVITKEEMVELVEENLDLLNEARAEAAVGRPIRPGEDCETIAAWLFNGDEKVLISTDDLQDQSPVLLQTVNIGLSWIAFAFFLLLSALIGFVMCRNSLSQAAIGGGVVFILLGGFTSLAAAVVAWIPGLWSSIAGNNMVFSIVGALLSVNSLIFAILLVVGILLLVARAVVKHILKKKQQA